MVPTISELLERPVIRNDKCFECFNKMTDEEFKEWENNIEAIINNNESVKKQFPDYNAEYLAKYIDFNILYLLFQKAEFKSLLTN